MTSFVLISYFFVFSFGLIIGSFLNSIIYRLSLPQKIKARRSFCPHCGHPLQWKDLIPLFSFLILRGRCRYCQKPISWQYPLVEFATGILFLLITNYQLSAATYQPNLEFFFREFFLLLISCFLLIIFVYDLRHFIIPDQIIYPAIAITFLYQLLGAFDFRVLDSSFKFQTSNLINPLFSALLALVFFFAIFLISRGKWLGFGDVKLAFLMGLFLGFPEILAALFFAFSIGAIIGLGLIISKKKHLQSKIPFGPFLVTGTFIALFWGRVIINWYLGLFNWSI